MIYPSHSTNKYNISFSIFNGSSSEQFHCSSILQSCHVHLPNATACVRTQQLRASFNSLGGEVFKTEWIDLAIKCFQLEVSNSQPTSYEKRAEAPSAPALKMLHCGRQSLPGLHCYCEDWRRGRDAVRGFCQVGIRAGTIHWAKPLFRQIPQSCTWSRCWRKVFRIAFQQWLHCNSQGNLASNQVPIENHPFLLAPSAFFWHAEDRNWDTKGHKKARLSSWQSSLQRIVYPVTHTKLSTSRCCLKDKNIELPLFNTCPCFFGHIQSRLSSGRESLTRLGGRLAQKILLYLTVTLKWPLSWGFNELKQNPLCASRRSWSQKKSQLSGDKPIWGMENRCHMLPPFTADISFLLRIAKDMTCTNYRSKSSCGPWRCDTFSTSH